MDGRAPNPAHSAGLIGLSYRTLAQTYAIRANVVGHLGLPIRKTDHRRRECRRFRSSTGCRMNSKNSRKVTTFREMTIELASSLPYTHANGPLLRRSGWRRPLFSCRSVPRAVGVFRFAWSTWEGLSSANIVTARWWHVIPTRPDRSSRGFWRGRPN
jgi:hypothetical protein